MKVLTLEEGVGEVDAAVLLESLGVIEVEAQGEVEVPRRMIVNLVLEVVATVAVIKKTPEEAVGEGFCMREERRVPMNNPLMVTNTEIKILEVAYQPPIEVLGPIRNLPVFRSMISTPPPKRRQEIMRRALNLILITTTNIHGLVAVVEVTLLMDHKDKEE